MRNKKQMVYLAIYATLNGDMMRKHKGGSASQRQQGKDKELRNLSRHQEELCQWI